MLYQNHTAERPPKSAVLFCGPMTVQDLCPLEERDSRTIVSCMSRNDSGVSPLQSSFGSHVKKFDRHEWPCASSHLCFLNVVGDMTLLFGRIAKRPKRIVKNGARSTCTHPHLCACMQTQSHMHTFAREKAKDVHAQMQAKAGMGSGAFTPKPTRSNDHRQEVGGRTGTKSAGPHSLIFRRCFCSNVSQHSLMRHQTALPVRHNGVSRIRAQGSQRNVVV